MIRRFLTVAIVVGVAIGLPSDLAIAADLVMEVSGPEEAIVGEELEISVTVRDASDGEPVEGIAVAFFGDAFFAGVSGEIRLGSAETNTIGVATFTTAFSVRGVHHVRVEVADTPEAEPQGVTIRAVIGPQIVASEAGVEIPGVGSWLVTFVIGSVWAVMIVAALWMVRVSRSGHKDDDEALAALPSEQPARRQRRRFNLAPIVAGAMIVIGLGLVTLLIRSPNTHHNFDPEGYARSPVAYLDAAYLYPGPGLADTEILTGDTIADGRALFLKLGCSGCHGLDAQGTATARSAAFATRSWLGTVVRTGLPGGMPAYSEVDLSEEDLDILHAFLTDARDSLAGELSLEGDTAAPPATTTTEADDGGEQGAPSFADVQVILQPNCAGCHGAAGGWSANDYDSVVNSGDNGPAVIPGNPEASLLAQKLLGTQTVGGAMPPNGALAQSDIEVIVDWIADGAAP